MSRKRNRDEVDESPQNKRHRFAIPQEEASFDFIKDGFGWGIKRIIASYVISMEPSSYEFHQIVRTDLNLAKWIREITNGIDRIFPNSKESIPIHGEQKPWEDTKTALYLSDAVDIDNLDWFVKEFNFQINYMEITKFWTPLYLTDPMPRLAPVFIERAVKQSGNERFYVDMATRAVKLEDTKVFEYLSKKPVVRTMLFTYRDFASSSTLSPPLLRLIRDMEFAYPELPVKSLKVIRNIITNSFVYTCMTSQDEKKIFEFEEFSKDMCNGYGEGEHPIELLLKKHFDFSGGSWNSLLTQKILEAASKVCPLTIAIAQKIKFTLDNFSHTRCNGHLALSFNYAR